MLALMRKTFWSHFWSEKSNNNLVYCPSSPPFNDHAAATSVRGILNGPKNQKLPSKNGHSKRQQRAKNISISFCLLSWWRLTTFCTVFQLNFWVDSGDLSPLYSLNSCKTWRRKICLLKENRVFLVKNLSERHSSFSARHGLLRS